MGKKNSIPEKENSILEKENINNEIIINNNWKKLISSVYANIIVAAIVSFFTVFFALNINIARFDERIKSLDQRVTRIENQFDALEKRGIWSSTVHTDASGEINPLELQNIIRAKQSQNVKISEDPSNCFTDKDLKVFKDNKIPDQVVNELLMENSFFDLVFVIKKMSPTDRQKLLDTSSNIAKKTWSSLGEISAEGQTDTGHEAELLIANAIVSKVKELISLSNEEINKKRP